MDVRELMETWLRQLEEWAVTERGGDDVCRWCAVNRGFHHRGCPIEAFVVGVRTSVSALRRSGLIEIPPMLSVKPIAFSVVQDEAPKAATVVERISMTHVPQQGSQQDALTEQDWLTLDRIEQTLTTVGFITTDDAKWLVEQVTKLAKATTADKDA